MDYKQISRSVYTVLDALGDSGGLSSILLSMSFTLSSIFGYNKQDNYLASKLYKESTDTPLIART